MSNPAGSSSAVPAAAGRPVLKFSATEVKFGQQIKGETKPFDLSKPFGLAPPSGVAVANAPTPAVKPVLQVAGKVSYPRLNVKNLAAPGLVQPQFQGPDGKPAVPAPDAGTTIRTKVIRAPSLTVRPAVLATKVPRNQSLLGTRVSLGKAPVLGGGEQLAPMIIGQTETHDIVEAGSLVAHRARHSLVRASDVHKEDLAAGGNEDKEEKIIGLNRFSIVAPEELPTPPREDAGEPVDKEANYVPEPVEEDNAVVLEKDEAPLKILEEPQDPSAQPPPPAEEEEAKEDDAKEEVKEE
ncbi:unnamed protein product [Amoebophrya sp. A120]|nr:unnamed protein product [Amoebophrya sp. A120]|eukprot:GSA120T00013281001.1